MYHGCLFAAGHILSLEAVYILALTQCIIKWAMLEKKWFMKCVL